MTENTETPPLTLTFSRLLDAPRELVFQAWTDPQHLARWWGPRGFTTPVCEVDLRVGGKLTIHMAGEGMLIPVDGEFLEIEPPSRLVFTTSAFEGADGSPGIVDLNTITFEDEGGKTRMTLIAVVTKATPEMAEGLDGMEQGWNESLDRLEELLAAA